MTTSAIVYHKSNGTIVFAIQEQSRFPNYKDTSCDEYCNRHALVRLETFDWAVGNAGRDFVLLRCDDLDTTKSNLDAAWLTFPLAAKALVSGNDKRMLQLAVQYLSTDGIDDQVGATIMDESMRELMRAQGNDGHCNGE